MPVAFTGCASGCLANSRCCSLDSCCNCWHNDNIPTTVIAKERIQVAETAFVDVVIWRLLQPLPGREHRFKYRLAYVVNEVCVLRYDNEAGKGDHRHIRGREVFYRFTTLDQLVTDFWADIAQL